jgi:hypothetical protein
VPPAERFVPSFAAEPPQELLPYGRWAQTLGELFHAAVAEIDTEGEDLGDVGDLRWFPDRGWNGRTYVPVTAPTANGFEVFGFVSFAPGDQKSDPEDFEATANFTEETADRNPDWSLDLSEEVLGPWRGEQGKTAEMTLVWGVPMVQNGAIVTAELAGLVVDQCVLVEERFTLIAPDAYRGDFLELRLWGQGGGEVAHESLYEDDDDE